MRCEHYICIGLDAWGCALADKTQEILAPWKEARQPEIQSARVITESIHGLVNIFSHIRYESGGDLHVLNSWQMESYRSDAIFCIVGNLRSAAFLEQALAWRRAIKNNALCFGVFAAPSFSEEWLQTLLEAGMHVLLVNEKDKNATRNALQFLRFLGMLFVQGNLIPIQASDLIDVCNRYGVITLYHAWGKGEDALAMSMNKLLQDEAVCFTLQNTENVIIFQQVDFASMSEQGTDNIWQKANKIMSPTGISLIAVANHLPPSGLWSNAILAIQDLRQYKARRRCAWDR